MAVVTKPVILDDTGKRIADAIQSVAAAIRVEGGGTGGIYVGPDEPTDPSITFWLDTSGNAGQTVYSLTDESGAVLSDEDGAALVM